MPRRYRHPVMKMFLYVLKDPGGRKIGGVLAVHAKCFGHALQKIAATLPEPDIEVGEISIWRGRVLSDGTPDPDMSSVA